ncbi:uncharacterized protein LOC141601536 [Silene latifolia]|uniref:uncharacterized protein LOC141601536 n=1 Tax=Silene latifolia TaxID=37657 RepID=UPI003D76F0F3
MKIDLQKAYDSIEWRFLQDMLSGLKFPHTSIELIMQCVYTPSYSLALNGDVFGFFKDKRGLRKRDPLSRGDLIPATLLLSIFETFSISSGLKMSSGKSSFYSNGVGDIILKGIEDASGKLFGGLGIVDTKQWNIAAVGKLVWWIARKKDNLWIQWVDKVYIKQTDCMDYKPTSASSWAWRKVCEIKEVFKDAYVQGKWSADDEKYTINDGYKWLTQHDMSRVPWFKSVWNKFIIPKHSFILWLLNQERLLTLDRLFKMGITQQTRCFLCGIHDENHRHLFQECVYARQCYTQLFAWLQMQVPVHLSTDSILRIRKHTGFTRLLLSSLVAAMQYHIWLCRNTCRVDGYVTHPAVILKRIKFDCRMRLMNISVGSLKRGEIDWCTQRGLM